MSADAPTVAVFIDWQNTYKTARDRGASGSLVRVNIHRGLPSQKYDADGYAANRRQSAAWMKEASEIVVPRLRPLRYSRDRAEKPREKGVDVELALAAVEWTLDGKCDVAIVFSHDTDLVPLVETLTRLKGPECIETASWTSETFNQRIRTKPPVHHHGISKVVFDRIETRVNYAHG